MNTHGGSLAERAGLVYAAAPAVADRDGNAIHRASSTPALAHPLAGTRNSTFPAASGSQSGVVTPSRYSLGTAGPAMTSSVPVGTLGLSTVVAGMANAARIPFTEGATDLASASDYRELARAVSPYGSVSAVEEAEHVNIHADRSSGLAKFSKESSRRRSPERSLRNTTRDTRSNRLYEDALVRRQRQKDLEDEAEQSKQSSLEECKRDALLKQRERQRFYRFRDTRTHEEREVALLKRREETTKSNTLKQQRKEELEYLRECTFQPKFFTRSQDGVRGPGQERSSSCGAVVRQAPQDRRSVSQTMQETTSGSNLEQLIVQQQALIRKFAEIEAETELVRTTRKDVRYAQADQLRETDLRLYKRNLEVVHSLDRLDMQVLELPQAQLDILLAKGYRLGLGEKGRRGLASPRESLRKSFAETPRNNLREEYGTEIYGATSFREGQEVCL